MNVCRLLCALLIVPMLFSCTSPRYVYTPTTVNVPYFQQKHDSKIAAYTSGGDSNGDTAYVRGCDFGAAYAISDHVAITAGYHRRHERNYYSGYSYDPFDSSVVRYNRSAWDVGGGYFLPLDKHKAFSASFYGGLGSGNFTLHESGRDGTALYTRTLTVHPFSFYLQPGIYFVSSSFRFSLGYRFDFIRYRRLTSDYSDAESQTLRLNGLGNTSLALTSFYLDAQVAHPKIPWLALEGQVSVTGRPSYYYVRSLNASAGLVIDLLKLLKRR